jgi:hypothetical protein
VNARHIIFTAAAVAVLSMAPRQAAAQPVLITAKIAFDPSISGTMHAGATGLTSGSTLVLPEQSWTDTHSTNSPLFIGGVEAPVNPKVAAVGYIEYGRAGSDTITLGTANGSELRGEFDPYKYWGLDGGVRAGGRTGAYGLATIGFRHVSDIGVTTSLAGLVKSPFYQSSTVLTYGFGAGYMFGTVGFEVAAKYAGALTADETAPRVFQEAATEGARWSLPISLVLRF